MKRLLTSGNVLSLFLIFIPVSLLLEFVFHAPPTAVFITSAVAIMPLAGWMGRATERLAEHVGEGLGGILNATFGNAAELIIAVIALKAGLHDLVKASITGSIVGNILLVFGLSALCGGWRHQTLSFNRVAAGNGATMLLLSVIALVVPGIFHMIAGQAAQSEQRLSLFIAFVLMATYLLSLFFALKTHSHLYQGAHLAEDSAAHPTWTRGRALGVLLGSAALVAVVSELLVGAAEHTAETLGMSEVFIGVVVVAIIGNAAEHSTAILVALKNKMDLSINIAVGSSMQIALFVTPLMIFLSYFIGPNPMNLRFSTMEVVAVAASVGIMAIICQDGQTHWMEGVQLLGVYAIIGTAFYFLPA